MKKIVLSIVILGSLTNSSIAQSVGIGTNTPDASSVLELKATNKGFLPPRMTASEKGLIPSPKAGLMIYQTDGTPGLYVYNGVAWMPVASAGSVSGGWSLTGNSGTNAAINFIGTTDAQLLKFRQNNLPSGFLDGINENVALGAHTLDSISGGGMNNAIGSQALKNTKIGYHNNAFGRRALFSNVDGSRNVAIGTSALLSNTNGNGNIAVGFNAAYGNVTGSNNIAIGNTAMYTNVSGFSNVAIGTHSLHKNLSGARLISIGDSALYHNTVGDNVALGSKALYYSETGVLNTAIGNQSLYSNSSGSQNTAVGRSALYWNNNGNQNTALGFQSLYNNQLGSRNTGVGYNSLILSVGGDDNTAVGFGSLAKTETSSNTAVGSNTLNGNTSGFRGTALGFKSLEKNTIGSYNTAVGGLSLGLNVDGYGNTAFGDLALSDNVNGVDNTGLGARALQTNVSGKYNTAIGFQADVYGTNYTNATAVGAFSEAGCSNCVVLGSINGYNSATASSKVGIGINNPQKTLHVTPNAGGGIAIGGNMTSGGYTILDMGISQETGGYAFLQGIKSSGSAYGNLVLNQSGGNVGIRTALPLTSLHIKQSTDYDGLGGIRLERNENGNIWDINVSYANGFNLWYNGVNKVRFSNIDGAMWTASDLRLKKDIQNFETALPRLMKLEAKSYRYKDNEDGAPLSYGFIAQEVEKIFPGAVSSEGKEGMKAIAYQKLNIMAIKSIQEQQVIIEAQQKQIDEVKQQNVLMMESIKKLESALGEIRDTKK